MIAPTEDERTWGMYAHLSGMLAYSGIPFGGVIGPLVVYLQSRTTRPFATQQARTAFNFHVTISILQIVVMIVGFTGYFSMIVTAVASKGNSASMPFVIGGGLIAFICGIGSYFLLYIFSFIYTLVNTIRASKGELVGYPLSIPFIRT